MKLNREILSIVNRAMEGHAPSKSDCQTMLSCDPLSGEATLIRGVADAVTRARFGNVGIVQGQIALKSTNAPASANSAASGSSTQPFNA